ncbi:lipase family protein [Myroides ceti]|uniref:Lipase family protein n=1 Tax=Paenimyroides ceti TaxID=395087 RepID=A0ABT8CP03_9FLAO|nr:lipase family protein [Paenimyroides ceti]MDN3705896.1 lipase family protein [Paenimyroides ceti]
MKKVYYSFLLVCLCCLNLHAQKSSYRFQSGFDAQECDDLLQLNNAFVDTLSLDKHDYLIPEYEFLHQSESIGLDNMWNLWMRSDDTAVISLRGTTSDSKSVLADFYCAMLPAKGEIVLHKKDTLQYYLATDERAALHAGFLIGFGYLAKDMLPTIDSLYQSGHHNFLVTGHSQGGSLSYYISAWLLHLKRKGIYPLMQVKTYACAPTKVGNMYFAYDYDNITAAKWSFSVVNTADPVPEMPLTTQQLEEDMNAPNPIMNLAKRFDRMPFFQRIFLKKAFNNMEKKATKSSEAYQKYLGKYCGKFIQKELPELKIPNTINTTYFVRPGVPITLLVNPAYYAYFQKVKKTAYYHHGIVPYRFLLREYYSGLSDLEPPQTDPNK